VFDIERKCIELKIKVGQQRRKIVQLFGPVRVITLIIYHIILE
jgi:hypothetical protein